MKKHTINIYVVTIFLALSVSAYGQDGRVGINTATPAATLDVVASPSISTRIDGFIAPRLKGSELKSKDVLYTAAQDGAIVYVTEAVSGTTNKTINVTAIGYYYFDKTLGVSGQWVRISYPYTEPWYNSADNSSATANTQNIYQMGKVAIGKTSVYSNGSTSAIMDVNGAMRAGGSHAGTVGSYSMAVGNGNEASGANSVSFGNSNKSIGNSALTIGNATTASGDYSFAGGNGAKAEGAYSFAFGNDAQALANHGFALGVGTRSPSRSSATFGRFNVVTTSSHSDYITQNYAHDPIFQVGTGVDDGNRRNIITAFYGYTAGSNMSSGWLAIGSQQNIVPIQATATDPLNPESGERLRVYGSVYATKYTAELGTPGGYADYVFQDYFKGLSTFNPSYKFQSLKNIETFIKDNGHLPGVTAYKDLKESTEGKKILDLNELSVQSLEKIEELYLHTIEQQKQIDELSGLVLKLQNEIQNLNQK